VKPVPWRKMTLGLAGRAPTMAPTPVMLMGHV
jgi:hypothetical protein